MLLPLLMWLMLYFTLTVPHTYVHLEILWIVCTQSVTIDTPHTHACTQLWYHVLIKASSSLVIGTKWGKMYFSFVKRKERRWKTRRYRVKLRWLSLDSLFLMCTWPTPVFPLLNTTLVLINTTGHQLTPPAPLHLFLHSLCKLINSHSLSGGNDPQKPSQDLHIYSQ